MDVVDNGNHRINGSDYLSLGGNHSMPSCPNCYHMMNEIVELRMQLNRIEKGEKRTKKMFTIAPTLYTFYRNGLSKRHLARYSFYFIYKIDLPVLLHQISWSQLMMMTIVI